ncbi:HEPN domain-containing protein [Azospirillum sp. YIM B02556]|uniref:HEPN domain-containing protein n=1 Tax=Azospirillum endophyticum TaxID=2800326 RepID=A0ABS1FD02_9PROT|nr:HEPN domain-containing protein [Azospirillum endophyticum]MBK1841285.1 HEPN domain-containing protein [Azospirillum endophyticum]
MERREVQGWLVVVERDVKAIRNNLYGPEPEPNMAAYHCQQAVEKLAKTLLVAAGTMPPKSHDIDSLVARFPTGHPMALRIAALAHLTAFIIAPRYPGAGIFDDPLPDLPVSEVAGWLVEIETLRNDIIHFLGIP